MDLTDEQWSLIREVVEQDTELKHPEKGGRPAQDARSVLNGILWVLRTGAPWAEGHAGGQGSLVRHRAGRGGGGRGGGGDRPPLRRLRGGAGSGGGAHRQS